MRGPLNANICLLLAYTTSLHIHTSQSFCFLLPFTTFVTKFTTHSKPLYFLDTLTAYLAISQIPWQIHISLSLLFNIPNNSNSFSKWQWFSVLVLKKPWWSHNTNSIRHKSIRYTSLYSSTLYQSIGTKDNNKQCSYMNQTCVSESTGPDNFTQSLCICSQRELPIYVFLNVSSCVS